LSWGRSQCRSSSPSLFHMLTSHLQTKRLKRRHKLPKRRRFTLRNLRATQAIRSPKSRRWPSFTSLRCRTISSLPPSPLLRAQVNDPATAMSSLRLPISTTKTSFDRHSWLVVAKRATSSSRRRILGMMHMLSSSSTLEEIIPLCLWNREGNGPNLSRAPSHRSHLIRMDIMPAMPMLLSLNQSVLRSNNL
jgi:hypothetical protein